MKFPKYHIEACIKGDRTAQKALYTSLSPVLNAICRRYMPSLEDAEDVLVDAFMRIFSNLSKYKGEGSFEGWARKITVNECLMALRKRQVFLTPLDQAFSLHSDEVDIHSRLAYDAIINLLDELPIGYRTVFNLYVVEGFKHKEIAESLNISINTSKSQLIQAKKKLASLIKKKHSQCLGS